MHKAPTFLLVMGLLIALALCQYFLPARDMSDMENRMLAQAPDFSLQSFYEGSFSTALENYASDQLPLRDHFVSLYSTMQRLLGRRLVSDAILGGGMMFDHSAGWSPRNVRMNAAALHSLQEAAGKPVYLLAVPSAAAVYAQQLPAHAPVADEEALFAAAGAETNLLPLLSRLQAYTGTETLYYATDHHWTAAGARLGYLEACAALGLEPKPPALHDPVPGFYGSFYARYPLPWINADDLSVIRSEGIRLIVNGEEKPGLIDPEALADRDKYAALLYGNHARIDLINNQAPDGTLLVIKDSYANALLPMLAMHYQRIIAVDPRYFAGNIIDLANTYEGEAILCIYGMNTLSTGRTIALLEGL